MDRVDLLDNTIPRSDLIQDDHQPDSLPLSSLVRE